MSSRDFGKHELYLGDDLLLLVLPEISCVGFFIGLFINGSEEVLLERFRGNIQGQVG